LTLGGPQAFGPQVIAPTIGAIPAVAAALGAALPAAVTAPVATVLGAVAPLTIFAAPAVLPFLIGSLFGSSPEELAASQFRFEASIPAGVDFNELFGISHLGGRLSAPPISDLNLVTGIGREFRTGGAIPFGPIDLKKTLGFHLRNAFSFVPQVAAAGEAKIQEFLNEQFVPARTGFFSRPRLGVPSQAVQAQIFENQKREFFETTRAAVLQAVAKNPFFSAVASASQRGLLPGTSLSARAADVVIPDFGGAPLRDFFQPAALTAARTPPPAPPPRSTFFESIPKPTRVGSLPPREVQPMTPIGAPAPGTPIPQGIGTVFRPDLVFGSGGTRLQSTDLDQGAVFRSQQLVSTRPVNRPLPGPAGPAPFTPRTQQLGAAFIENRANLIASRGGTQMANVSTTPGFFGGLQSALTGLGSLVSAATPLIQTFVQPQQRSVAVAMPGGARIAGQFQDPRLQVQQAGFGRDVLEFGLGENLTQSLLGPAANTLTGGACITPVPSRQTMRLPSRVDVPTIDSRGNQRFTTFMNMGHPLVFSKDVQRRKQVKKAIRRLGGG